MTRDATQPFPSGDYDLEPARTGAAVRLALMTPEEADRLGAAFAAMSPWLDYQMPAASLQRFFAMQESDAPRWSIHVDDALAGAVVIRRPWLHGPYLQFLGITEGFREVGVGASILEWMEQEALGRYRNLWLCVSATNVRAEAFYARYGYRRVAALDGLVADGMDEILMRRQLE